MRKLILSLLAPIIYLTLVVPLATGEVFLQTDVVEIGIHDAFSFGTAGAQPSGFHGNRGGHLVLLPTTGVMDGVSVRLGIAGIFSCQAYRKRDGG